MMPIEINQFNVNAGLLNKYKNVVYFNSFWHQILVENVQGLDRDAVLRSIMRFCQPFHFIPVHYTSSGNQAHFLLKNCGSAIKKLCLQGLVLANPYDKDKPFKITIQLCYSSSTSLIINIQSNLIVVLNKRFNSKTGVLNLENFAKDPELEEYCALSQSKLFFYVLHLAKNLQFKVLRLLNNDIVSLKSMEALEGFKAPICIDLRNNNIKEVEEIENLRHLNVTELSLDGNPICNNYDATNYGKAMKDCLEKLEKLDGINVQFKGFLPFRRNFLCNYSGFDLVDQFLEHYFTLYDAQNRSILEEVYHKDALFSLTSMYIPWQSTSATAKLSTYKQVSRNLKNLSDFSKATHGLYVGRTQIIKLLSSLPFTEHDPYSFSADLVMYTETMAVLIVTGVFRESSASLLESDRMLGFSRTFVLLAGPHGDYSIVNEMLNITNATSNRATAAFKYPKISKLITIPHPQNAKERSELTDTLTAITGLKMEWSQKCLEECRYDFKEALNLFIELHKKDKIPKSAFFSEQEKNEFKNRARINEQSTTVTSSGTSSSVRQRAKPPAMVSPAKSKQPAGQPTSVNFGQNLVAPFAKVGQLHNQFLSRPLSPDHVWNKYSSVKKESHVTYEPIEIIDLVDSPEQESHYEPECGNSKHEANSNPTSESSIKNDRKYNGSNIVITPVPLIRLMENRNSQNQTEMHMHMTPAPSGVQGEPNTGVKRTASPPPSEQSKKKVPRQVWWLVFQTELAAFQREYVDDFQRALDTGVNILAKYSIEFDVFDVMMTWLYQTNLEHARIFNERLSKISNWKSPFLNVNLIDLIIAKSEYKFGDEALGEQKFRSMMAKRQMWARPVTEFCKVMIEKNQVNEARLMLRPYVTGKHPLKKKMLRIVKRLTQEYNIKLT